MPPELSKRDSTISISFSNSSQIFDCSKTEFEKEIFEDPFIRTKRPFGGLINDIKKRYSFYISDFTDAWNLQSVSTIFFLFFASIAHVITFAGLMGQRTDNYIGVSETLISTAISGVIFGLFSGQPLLPVGPTEPLTLFDELLYSLCKVYKIEFLPFRCWISIWHFLICFVVVLVEGSVLAKWFTRFTQDIFAVLTSFLLVFASMSNLVEIYINNPLSKSINKTSYIEFEDIYSRDLVIDETQKLTQQPNTALFCTILMFGTFSLSFFLRNFKHSIYLCQKLRQIIGDFCVTISVILMVILAYISSTYTQKLKVPQGLQPSSDKRDWLVFPIGNGPINFYAIFGSILPALLLFILTFMTTEICELLINSKERKLKKGSGFHLDLLLIAITNLIGGFFGAPWLCCAAVRGLAHVSALSVYSTKNSIDEKPELLFVREQRVTSIIVAIMIGCSVLLAPILKFIPLAVLYGVFLYLGVTTFCGTQMYQRIKLFFIPPQNHPRNFSFVSMVTPWKMHMYTLIQLGGIGILWAIKSSDDAALAFPFILLCMVPTRYMLKYIFNKSELDALDGN